MIDEPIGKIYSKVVNTLVFVFPIIIISLQVAGDIVLFILAMMGIYIAISKKISPFSIKEIKVFSYLTFSYFIAVCLSVVFSGQALELMHYIPRDFYFLFAPFIALALFKAKINLNYLLNGIKFALLFLGLILLMGSYHFLINDYNFYPRYCGVMNCGVFGNLAVVMFFIAFIFFQYEPKKYTVFTLLSLVSGIYIIITSQTRGAWLSALLLVAVNIYFFYRKKNKLNNKSKTIIASIFAILIYVIANNPTLNDRKNDSLLEISNWVSGDQIPSSIGMRLGMYTKAIDEIENVPFFGHGYRTSNIVLFENDYSIVGRRSVGFNHLHNAYLTNYYNGGIVLLSALLLLLFVPLIIFLKVYNQNRGDPVLISGVILTIGYASFGMVNILLGDTYMNGFYVFFLAIFMVLTNKSRTD